MGRCAGAFSDYALMEAQEAMMVPPGLSWEEVKKNVRRRYGR
jgi:NADPH:quinone reductase-like Zn-dependent oxidoreductase